MMPDPPILGTTALHILGVAADIIGIASFFLTVALLIRSEALRKEIEAQKQSYQKDRESIRIKMIALRENLWHGQKISLKLISETRTLLFSFDQNYNFLHTRKDKRELPETLKLLKQRPESIDPFQLCAKLD